VVLVVPTSLIVGDATVVMLNVQFVPETRDQAYAVGVTPDVSDALPVELLAVIGFQDTTAVVTLTVAEVNVPV
jgi:hypothetical protein